MYHIIHRSRLDHKFQLISFDNKLPEKLIRVFLVALLNSGSTVYNKLRLKCNILALCGVHLRYRLSLYHNLNGTIFPDVCRNFSGGKKRARLFWIDAQARNLAVELCRIRNSDRCSFELIYRNYSPPKINIINSGTIKMINLYNNFCWAFYRRIFKDLNNFTWKLVL